MPLTFPVAGPETIVDALKATLKMLKAQNKRASVCVVSQVSSAPAIVFPVAEIVRILKAEGIASVVDGAHALGAVPTDITVRSDEETRDDAKAPMLKGSAASPHALISKRASPTNSR